MDLKRNEEFTMKHPCGWSVGSAFVSQSWVQPGASVLKIEMKSASL